MSYVIDPLGRVRIGVDQQPGGSNYPLVDPSADIQDLLADAFLLYEDDRCSFTPPFHIAWMYGFGGITSAPPSWAPSPTHPYDIVIKDANGATVFDSTQAGSYTNTAWGAAKAVLEWTAAYSVLRLVIFTAWDANQTPRDYNQNLAPASAVFDARALLRAVPRVRSFLVAGQMLAAENVRFQNGYNTTLTTIDPKRVDGGRLQHNISFDAIPGAGTGRYPGCQAGPTPITRINGQTGDPQGDFKLDLTGCYRLQRPNTVISTSPPQVDVTPGALQLFNDCGPCCTCDEFVSVYEAIRILRARYVSLGVRAERARDTYSANRTRWLQQKACRENNPLRLSVFPNCPNQVNIGAGFCNTTKGCLENVQLKFHFTYNANGINVSTPAGFTLVCGSSFRSGNVKPEITGQPADVREATLLEPYAPHVAWPIATFYFDKIQPGSQATAMFRMAWPVGPKAPPPPRIMYVVMETLVGGTLFTPPVMRDSGLLAPDHQGHCPCDTNPGSVVESSIV